MAKMYYIYAPMNTGKSAYLLMKAHSFLENNTPILCIKPAIDDRDGKGVIKSRVGLEMQCLAVDADDNIMSIITEYNANLQAVGMPTPQWILCDESQFLTEQQVEQLSCIVDNLGINVMCYGLRDDFTGHLFPGSRRLFELADNIEEIKLSCSCGRKAVINARFNDDGEIVTDGEQIKVGGNDIYKPVCRKCYRDMVNRVNFIQ